MTNRKDLHPEWKERLDYVVTRANLHLADLHRSKEFIIERGYKFIGLYNIFLVAVSTFASPFILVKLMGIVVFLVVLALLYPIISPSSNMTQGISAKLVELNKLSNPTGSQWFLNPDSFFASKKTQTKRYYGWLFHSLQVQEDDVIRQIQKLGTSYQRAFIATWVGTGVIVTLWTLFHLNFLA